MKGKFELRNFRDIDFNDTFFDELKLDYKGTLMSISFVEWSKKKAEQGKQALIYEDESGLGAFVCIKLESEEIQLKDRVLKAVERIKISTFRIAERYRGQRLGECLLGLLLLKWKQTEYKEIYVTVYEKHSDLIMQLEKIGFKRIGYNMDNECIYVCDAKEKLSFNSSKNMYILECFDEMLHN